MAIQINHQANAIHSPSGKMLISNPLGIGGNVSTGQTFKVASNISGSVNSYGIVSQAYVWSDVTNSASMFYSGASTPPIAFTLTALNHYVADQNVLGAGSTITAQRGFYVSSTLTGGTTNVAFHGDIPSGTGRYNLYMGGSADNYMAGKLGIGSVPPANINLYLGKTVIGAVTAYGISQPATIYSDVTNLAALNATSPSTLAASFTLGSLYHYWASQGVIGAGSTVTSQFGFIADASLIGGTNNYGFFGNIPSGTGRYNLYMGGTASNYLKGSTQIDGMLTLKSSTVLTGAAATYRSNYLQTNGSDRFVFGLDDVAEGGSNAGSNFFIDAKTDAGVQIQRVLYITRSTGAVTLTGELKVPKSVTATGTTGAQTINKQAGSVNFAAMTSSLVVTNSLVSASSIILATVGNNDTTMKSVTVVAGAGSFTIYANAASTSETKVNFLVLN